jgi:pyruvate/2-oxoglutarate/acetoin dehydrogenase E1 component
MTTAEKRELTYVEAVREALADALEADPRVFIMGEEVGLYGGVFRATQGLQQRFGPERVRDTPICEASMIGAATGAAIVGRRPIVEIMFMDFIASAMDSIANHAAKLRAMSGGQIRVPMVIRTQGGTGTQHGPQHSQMLESWLAHIPGLLVAMPTTPEDVKGLFLTAVAADDPVVFIEHRLLYRTTGTVEDPTRPIPFGQAAIRRAGTDLTIVATSNMNLRALEAATSLAEDGIEAEVIDPRTLVPLDTARVIESVARTGRLLVVHEEVERSGWGGELIAAVIGDVFSSLRAAPVRLATRNTPIPFGADLEAGVVPQGGDIIEAARQLVRA